MGCNGSKSVAIVLAAETEDSASGASPPAATDGSTTRPVTPQLPQPVPPSMAFDIPFDDNADEASIVKKHPPRRLQRLEEQQQQQASLTLEELQEKQQEAENRRIQFLQLRAQSAKRKYAMRNNNQLVESPTDAQEQDQNQESGYQQEEEPGNQ